MRTLSIIPALVSVPVSAQTSQRTRNIALNWNRAVAAGRAARQEMEQFHRDTIQPVLDAFRAGEASTQEAVEAEDSERPWTYAYESSARRLVETPAPSLEAVVAKLRIDNRHCMLSSEPDPDPLLERIADEIMLFSSRH